MEWIKVSDRLPEDTCVHFVWAVNVYNEENHFHYRYTAFYTKGDEVKFDDEDDLYPEACDEKTGESYLPAGWWHEAHDEEKYYPIAVTHWIEVELPDSLKQKFNKKPQPPQE